MARYEDELARKRMQVKNPVVLSRDADLYSLIWLSILFPYPQYDVSRDLHARIRIRLLSLLVEPYKLNNKLH
jgi:hypothetical protein